MSEEEQFIAQINDYWTEHGEDDPLEAFRKTRELIVKESQDGGLLDPDTGNQGFINNVYRYVHSLSLNHRMPPLADTILREWWKDLGVRQHDKGKKYHRALPAFHLGALFLGTLDHGMAFRWFLHTHADDILNYHEKDGAAGAANLEAVFGLSAGSVAKLTEIAKACRSEAEVKGWRNKAAYPEEVVRRFIGADMAYSHQMNALPAKGEFPLSPGYLQALLDDMDEAARHKDDDAKGKSLETVGFYLFSLLPGCVPKSNVLALDTSYEDDIIVRDLYRENNIISDTFGRQFLVECKHRNGPIQVQEVGYFLFRMKMQHTKFGVMLSNLGITGGKNGTPERAARAEIMRAYHEDGSICIVLTRENLEELVRKDSGFFWMLLEKYEEYRFGRPKAVRRVKPRRPKTRQP